MRKKEMAIYIAILVLIAIIMLLFFYNSIKPLGSILLAALFLSLILRTMYAHKKPNLKTDKTVAMKKFYSIILLISIFLTILFNNPNYTYSSLAIGILSLIFLFATEYLTKQKTRVKYYLFAYLALIVLFKIKFEAALVTDQALYYTSAITLGILSLLFIYLTIKHDFKQEKSDSGYSLNNEIEEDINIVKKDFKKLTDVDHLYEALSREKSIKLSKVAQNFSIPREKAEEWARILEEGGLAILHYPAIGEPELRWKSIR